MSLTLTIPAEHPAFAGHFPGRPVLPAAVLLDEVLQGAPAPEPGQAGLWHIAHAKFLRAVGPGETLTVTYTARPGRSLHFEVTGLGKIVAQGTLVSCALPQGPADARLR